VESAGLAQRYALTGIAEISGEPIAFIMERATQQRLTPFGFDPACEIARELPNGAIVSFINRNMTKRKSPTLRCSFA
jgi:hypothetical protein